MGSSTICKVFGLVFVIAGLISPKAFDVLNRARASDQLAELTNEELETVVGIINPCPNGDFIAPQTFCSHTAVTAGCVPFVNMLGFVNCCTATSPGNSTTCNPINGAMLSGLFPGDGIDEATSGCPMTYQQYSCTCGYFDAWCYNNLTGVTTSCGNYTNVSACDTVFNSNRRRYGTTVLGIALR